MRDLIYYTIGYGTGFIPLLDMSLKTLRVYHPTIDVAVICDESIVEDCGSLVSKYNVILLPCQNAKTPEEASMHKLLIFHYPLIHSYDRILFLDADILVHVSVDPMFEKVVDPTKLYVYIERTAIEEHANLFWSLQTYQQRHYDYFRAHNIFVFNAGCFFFYVNDEMKKHFEAVIEMIRGHVGSFFYEQSFMNVYFNTHALTDGSVLIEDNYKMGYVVEGVNYEGKLVHFAGSRDRRPTEMRTYMSSLMKLDCE